MRTIKAICITCWETPWGAWMLLKLLVGTIVMGILGCIIFGCAALYEEIKEWSQTEPSNKDN